jgi:hypothetical protein
MNDLPVIDYGICLLSVIPLRREPSHTSEMVSQVLFGEVFSITGTLKGWAQGVMKYDGYQGWIDAKQYLPVPEPLFKSAYTGSWSTTTSLFSKVTAQNGHSWHLAPGSSLSGITGNEFRILGDTYAFDGICRKENKKVSREQFVRWAQMFLNTPYLWGGRTPFGIDCSGFTQIICKMAGIRLKRDACEQALQGTTVNFLSEAQSGDLLFFENGDGKITHTGILVDPAHIIHASGRVRIDIIDHYGIFNPDSREYTHQLRLIKSHFH